MCSSAYATGVYAQFEALGKSRACQVGADIDRRSINFDCLANHQPRMIHRVQDTKALSNFGLGQCVFQPPPETSLPTPLGGLATPASPIGNAQAFDKGTRHRSMLSTYGRKGSITHGGSLCNY
jgi:hypothetical protein